MLKRLSTVALLIAVMQAPAAITGQTASLPVTRPSHSPDIVKHTDEVGAKEANHSVIVTSVPPLTLVGKKKTLSDYIYEWGPWFFGLFLAIAGGVQLWLMRVTWKAIKEQKIQMEKQTGILENSVAAAQTSADAAYEQIQMMKGKERARLVIFAPDKPTLLNPRSISGYDEEFLEAHINMSIINDGGTKAFNVRGEGSVEVSASAEPSKEPSNRWEKMQIPEIVREMDAENPLRFTMRLADTGDIFRIPSEYLFAIPDNTAFLWVEGIIVYDDVFGDSHRTPFCYRWKEDRAEHGVSEWINHSKASS